MIQKINYNLLENDVTNEQIYTQRRQFIKQLVGLGVGASLLSGCTSDVEKNTLLDITEYDKATHYNNFYELGSEKTFPAKNADHLKIDPWSITVSGACEKPGTYHLEDILKRITIEQRIYRFRCVEGWSMVLPWDGFELGLLLKQFKPLANAKYIYFESIYDPENLPYQRHDFIQWPYREGLRMDEAMHPLTFLATGMYGKTMPNQNGAPLRLVIPWKYGYKGLKSIVRIHFTEFQPVGTWELEEPNEYKFYSNVNPNVAHSRWNQSTERRLGELNRRETLLFNGYGEQVAGLYKAIDLTKNT